MNGLFDETLLCEVCNKKRNERYNRVCIHCGAFSVININEDDLKTQKLILLRLNRCPHPDNSYICDQYGDDCEWCIKSCDEEIK